MKKNNGEVPMYHVREHHSAIISLDVFEQVRQKMQAVPNAAVIMLLMIVSAGLVFARLKAAEKDVGIKTCPLNELRNYAVKCWGIFRRTDLPARCRICLFMLMAE